MTVDEYLRYLNRKTFILQHNHSIPHLESGSLVCNIGEGVIDDSHRGSPKKLSKVSTEALDGKKYFNCPIKGK